MLLQDLAAMDPALAKGLSGLRALSAAALADCGLTFVALFALHHTLQISSDTASRFPLFQPFTGRIS